MKTTKQQAETLATLALELLAQEVVKTLPASERPAELQAATHTRAARYAIPKT